MSAVWTGWAGCSGAQGRVLPDGARAPRHHRDRSADSTRPTRTQLTTVRGQVEVATTPGQVRAVHLDPEDPPVCREASRRVASADWVVLGPGSWFTSVIPHLLVPALRDALVQLPGTQDRGAEPCAHSRARPRASHPSSTSRCSPSMPLTWASTWCSPTRPPLSDRDVARARHQVSRCRAGRRRSRCRGRKPAT